MFVSKTESLDRDKLEQYQLIKFRNMLGSILETNLFYRKKLNEVGLINPADIQTLADYQQIPFTTKENMIKIAVNLFNAEGVELVIHGGDFIAPFAVAAMSDLNCKVIGVFGNNDGERIGIAKGFESVGEVHNNLAEVAVGNRKICAMHYPELAEAIAKSGEYDIVIYGHTHQIDVRQEKSLILNPGEVGGWVTGKSTVAIVDLNSLEVEIHEL